VIVPALIVQIGIGDAATGGVGVTVQAPDPVKPEPVIVTIVPAGA
jgi:hypothetical protein